jgi:hypothetical protein
VTRESPRPGDQEEGKTLSDDIRDLEQDDELEDQDEVEGHIAKIDANDEPDDDVEAHIKLD